MTKLTDQEKVVLLVTINALSHMIEYCDTNEATDIHAAYSLMANSQPLKEWLTEYAILLPLRRDGRTLLERIENYR